jgi:hypothetical protein
MQRFSSHLLFLLGLAVTAGCDRPSPVAILAQHDGSVVRDEAAQVGAWKPAKDGDGFHVGDAVRTGERSRAKLELRGGPVLRMTSHTLVRFLAAPPGADVPRIQVDTGQATVEAGRALHLWTHLGKVVLEEGTTLVMRADGDTVRYEVRVGAAFLEQEDGRRVPIHAGGGLLISVGGAILEDDDASAHAEEPAGEEAAPVLAATAPVPRVTTAGPERVHFHVSAGESFTVRDSAAPTAIGFRFGTHCAGAGVVELVSPAGRVQGASRGRGVAHLWVPPGLHRYRVRCVSGAGLSRTPAAGGSVRVLRDAGSVPLPRTPPTTLMEVDGRRYTVLYQNLLPEVVVRWPKAPTAERLSLHVASPRGQRVIPLASARHTFKSGALIEGRYEVHFEAPGGRRSPTTTLVIAFDNAASTLNLREPSNRGFAPGSSTHVAGMALPGWTVSVGGTPLPLDRQRRFSHEVAVPGGQDGFAVRLSHPQRGVQYYVRRAREVQ